MDPSQLLPEESSIQPQANTQVSMEELLSILKNVAESKIQVNGVSYQLIDQHLISSPQIQHENMTAPSTNDSAQQQAPFDFKGMMADLANLASIDDPVLATTPNRMSETNKISNQLAMKKHRSDITSNEYLNSKFIVSESMIYRPLCGRLLDDGINGVHRENAELREIQKKQHDEIVQLKSIQKELTTFVVQHFTPKNMSSISNEGIQEILSQAHMQNAKLHLAFLFSSPLVQSVVKGTNTQMVAVNQIDHEKEFHGVLDSLNITGMQINYCKVQATTDKIMATLTENPIAFHFSGHSVGEESRRPSIKISQNKGYLLIEDQKATANLLPDTLLKEILESQGVQPEFVFVASCHSQFAGEIFHHAGAKHVICVKKNFKISDEASICFSKTFYTALFSQQKTVCEAFDIAISHLKSQEDQELAKEYEKFMLLKDKNINDFDHIKDRNVDLQTYGYKKKVHQCRTFGPFKPGKATDVGVSPMFRVETSKIEDFIGRTDEMHDLISCIVSKRRVVNVMGIPGIGKTTLVKAVAYYLDERQHMRDGIIMLSLRNLDQASMMLTRLELIVNKKLKDQQPQTNSDDKIVLDKLVNFFRDKEVLLILDNAETTSRKDPANFKEIIQTLLDKCPQVRFLFTSRQNIGHFDDHVEKVVELKELHIEYAVELFKKKAPREITDKEIEELLMIRPDKVLNSNPMRKVHGKFESHHIFDILKGHPHAISLAAPLLQDKKLKELYNLLNSDEMNDWLESNNIKGDSMGSLKVSMDISIQQLTETELKFFYLIGLLPGGCTESDLDIMHGQLWAALAEKLLRSSLLVKKNNNADENIYQLFPFMNQYATSKMNLEDKTLMHNQIARHFTVVCRDLLKAQLDARTNKFLQIETNIWACIYRMRDKVSECEARARSPGISQNSSSLATPMSSALLKPTTSSDSASMIQSSNGSKLQQVPPVNDADAMMLMGIDNMSSLESDPYDSLLSRVMVNGLGKERSKSEKIKKNMRGQDEEETKGDHDNNLDDNESNFQTENHPVDRTFNESLIDINEPILLVRKSSDNGVIRLEKKISLPSNSQQNMLNHSFNGMLIATNEQHYQNMLNQSNSDNSLSLQYQPQNHYLNFDQSIIQQQQFNNTSSNQSSFFDQLEATSSDSMMQSQFLNNSQAPHYLDISNRSMHRQNNNIRLNYNNMPELIEEESMISYDEPESNMNPSDINMINDDNSSSHKDDNNSSDSDEIIQSSTKFYQENHPAIAQIIDQSHNYLDESFTAIDGTDTTLITNKDNGEKDSQRASNLKKGKQTGIPSVSKRVTIQENLPKTQKFSKDDEVIVRKSFNKSTSKPQTYIENKQNAKQSPPCVQIYMTVDGNLIVYYLTNLLLMAKYEEALNVIEKFGIKLFSDHTCQANLRKLQGYALQNSNNSSYRDARERYEESLKLFTTLKSVHGQALCNWALGLLFYSHTTQFITKNCNEGQVFNQAKMKLEVALSLYQQCKHKAGESECHRYLQFIKSKLKIKDTINHAMSQKLLMKEENRLQAKGKSNFIRVNNNLEGIEASLFLEVIGGGSRQEDTPHQEEAKSTQSIQACRKKTKAESSLTQATPKFMPDLESTENNLQISNLQNMKKLKTSPNINKVFQQIPDEDKKKSTSNENDSITPASKIPRRLFNNKCDTDGETTSAAITDHIHQLVLPEIKDVVISAKRFQAKLSNKKQYRNDTNQLSVANSINQSKVVVEPPRPSGLMLTSRRQSANSQSANIGKTNNLKNQINAVESSDSLQSSVQREVKHNEKEETSFERAELTDVEQEKIKKLAGKAVFQNSPTLAQDLFSSGRKIHDQISGIGKGTSYNQLPTVVEAMRSEQKQYISFNITTTTTVKIEGEMIPTSLIIGPSVTLGQNNFQQQ